MLVVEHVFDLLILLNPRRGFEEMKFIPLGKWVPLFFISSSSISATVVEGGDGGGAKEKGRTHSYLLLDSFCENGGGS